MASWSRARWAAILGLFGAVVLAGFALAGRPFRSRATDESGLRVVRVAAASDLRFVLDEVALAFERGYPGVDVQIAYGASGTLYAQLLNRAPFDVFLSADVHYPRQLVGALDTKGDVFVYAAGRLALWVPRASPVPLETLGMRALVHPAVRRIAIANPKYAPYGRAAEAALRAAGLYDEVRSRLVFGENVLQAASFVQSGAAEIGILARSLALAPRLRAAGRLWIVPEDVHPRLEHGGLVLPWAADARAATAFAAFLRSDAGREILKHGGFEPL